MNNTAITACHADAVLVCETAQQLDRPVVIGHGSVLVVSGYAGASSAYLVRADAILDDMQSVALHVGYPRDDVAKRLAPGLMAALSQPQRDALARNVIRRGGYWGLVTLTARSQPMRRLLRVNCVLSDGRMLTIPGMTLETRPDFGSCIPLGKTKVAICMATYNPDIDAFERQIESIRRQTVADWHCIVCDDASAPAALTRMREICARDARFSLIANETNIGFYANFERALSMVPADVEFVALADQDDEWFADKLQRLVALCGDGVGLVYSDMRIKDANGDVVTETYWTNRKNNCTDADIILLANTVTGAASLFPRRLLDIALPFPPRIGDAFHDHWLACAALAVGRLAYVDAPLYDYRQHAASVIGHCDFESRSLLARVAATFGAIGRSLLDPRRVVRRIVRSRASGYAVHRQECRRIEVILATLAVRVPVMTDNMGRGTRLFSNGWRSGLRLIAHHASVLRRGETTNDAELRLGMGYLITELSRRFYRLLAAHAKADGDNAAG